MWFWHAGSRRHSQLTLVLYNDVSTTALLFPSLYTSVNSMAVRRGECVQQSTSHHDRFWGWRSNPTRVTNPLDKTNWYLCPPLRAAKVNSDGEETSAAVTKLICWKLMSVTFDLLVLHVIVLPLPYLSSLYDFSDDLRTEHDHPCSSATSHNVNM